MASKAAVNLPALFDDLVRVETRLYNALGETLRAEHGIVTSQFELLRYVRDHPRCRVADVAAYLATGIGAISKGVDRHVANGWVERLPNPADRRSSLIALTPAGADLVAAAEVTFTARLAELTTSALDAEQIAAVRESLTALRRSLENAGVGLPAG